MKKSKLVLIGVLAIGLLALPILMGAASLPHDALARDETRFLATVRAYLNFGRDYAEFCKNKEAVAVTAASSLKDLYEAEHMANATKALKGVLKYTESQVIRNALHMALKEVYERTSKHELAAQQLAKLISENN